MHFFPSCCWSVGIINVINRGQDEGSVSGLHILCPLPPFSFAQLPHFIPIPLYSLILVCVCVRMCIHALCVLACVYGCMCVQGCVCVSCGLKVLPVKLLSPLKHFPASAVHQDRGTAVPEGSVRTWLSKPKKVRCVHWPNVPAYPNHLSLFFMLKCFWK